MASLEMRLISFLQRIRIPLARAAFFVVYFWFGLLKFLDLSPASPLAENLQRKTLPFVDFHSFFILFALFEMVIGILFLMPKFTKLAIVLFLIHIVTTLGPLFLLPGEIWQRFLVPTLEGQYIIKNIVLIALAAMIYSEFKTGYSKQNIAL